MKFKNQSGGPKTSIPPGIVEDLELSSLDTCKDRIYSARGQL